MHTTAMKTPLRIHRCLNPILLSAEVLIDVTLEHDVTLEPRLQPLSSKTFSTRGAQLKTISGWTLQQVASGEDD